MIHVARPRDYRVAGGSEPTITRPHEKDGQWVVDCYDDRGAWEWTHYGEKSLNKRQAKHMAKMCNRIQTDLDAKKIVKAKSR
jgi:hypothetical protein